MSREPADGIGRMIGSRRNASEPFSLRFEQFTKTRLAPGAPARLLARCVAGVLDRCLVDGTDPVRSTRLAARALTLTSRSHREQLAAALERVLEAARSPQPRHQATLQRRAIRESRDALIPLTIILRSSTPLKARGLALVTQLITDGCGPLYVSGQPDLPFRIEQIYDELL